MNLNFEVTQKAQPESRNLIARKLQEFNAPHFGEHPFGTLDVYVRDGDDQLVGGLIGEFTFGWLSVRVLWITESLRAPVWEPGYCLQPGTPPLNTAEKQGYVRVGDVDGYPGAAQKIFMPGNLLHAAG